MFRYQDIRGYLGYVNTPLQLVGKQVIMGQSCKYWKGQTREWADVWKFSNSRFTNPTCGTGSGGRHLQTTQQSLKEIYDAKFREFQPILTVLTAIAGAEAEVERIWKGSVGVVITELARVLEEISFALDKVGAAFHVVLGPILQFFSTIIDKVRSCWTVTL